MSVDLPALGRPAVDVRGGFPRPARLHEFHEWPARLDSQS